MADTTLKSLNATLAVAQRPVTNNAYSIEVLSQAEVPTQFRTYAIEVLDADPNYRPAAQTSLKALNGTLLVGSREVENSEFAVEVLSAKPVEIKANRVELQILAFSGEEPVIPKQTATWWDTV